VPDLLDGFLFLEFTDGKGCGFATRYSDKNARKKEWLWLLDRLHRGEIDPKSSQYDALLPGK